jgi:exodeoxyribonuclease V alpha subunit
MSGPERRLRLARAKAKQKEASMSMGPVGMCRSCGWFEATGLFDGGYVDHDSLEVCESCREDEAAANEWLEQLPRYGEVHFNEVGMNEVLLCEVVSWRDEPRESSGWHIVRVRTMDDVEHTVTGCNLPRPGSRCEFRGEWQSSKWGEQFHVRSITATKPPLTSAGVERWLADRCEGIGRAKAAAILTYFDGDPARLWAALETGPNALSHVPGLNAELSAHVHECFEAEGAAREHYATLRGWRLTQAQITRILKHWPVAEACTRLYDDPYLLAEHISGFGFKRADEIAAEIGVPKHSRQRMRAGILHALGEAAQAGHVYGDLMLFEGISQSFLRVPLEQTVDVLKELLAAGRVIGEDGARMYLPIYERAEREAAERTLELLRLGHEMRDGALPRDYTKGALEAAKAIGHKLQPQQLVAINLAADMFCPFAMITGGPGTGKTTILQYAIEELRAQGVQVLLVAPTGKAAKRMTEATRHAAQTLHRMLEFRPDFLVDCETCARAGGRFERVSIDRCAVFIDEASMVDVQLWAELMRAVQRGGNRAVVRFVGDADQLPPVGPGQPFQDHLRALADDPQADCVVRLDRMMRAKGESWVAESAPLVLAGRMPSLEPREDFQFIRVERADRIAPAIEDLLRGGLDFDPWNARVLHADYVPKSKAPTGVPAPVLVPQHKGLAGVAVINRLLSEHYNPHAVAMCEEDLIRIALEDGTDLRIGARVLCTKNDYQRNVRNGDTGVIESMVMERDKRGEPRPKVLVRLDPDETTAREALEAQEAGTAPPQTQLVEYSFTQAREQLSLAYAMTIHKSQGSQYPWVVVVCHSSHARMLSRRLIYTALTRASEGVVLVGDRAGLERAVNNAQEQPRNTWLKQRLQAGIRAAAAARAASTESAAGDSR